VSLPFLMVNANGAPAHLKQNVSRAKLAELAAMGVYVVREAALPPSVAAPAAEAPKKKPWWKF